MPEELCRLGAAFVTQEQGRPAWTIGNDRISKTVAWEAGCGYSAALTNAATGFNWPATDEADEFRITWNGTTLTGKQARGAEGAATADEQAIQLVVDIDLSDTLRIKAYYRCTSSNAVIQQWIEVLAGEDGRLSNTTTPIAAGHSGPARLHWVRGLQTEGDDHDGEKYQSFRLQQVELGEQTISSGRRSTILNVPWFVLSGADQGEGIFAGLEYTGRWEAQAGRGGGDALALTISPAGIAIDLAAGEHWSSPAIFVGVFAGDLDDAAAVQHCFYRDVLSPPLPADFPWVQYNTWFSYFCDFDEAILQREADLAADLGVELFYIDAGWWLGNPRYGSHFSSGIGNWTVSPDKFPDGLRPFADYVRSRGMRFGIWIEPERVDLRTASTGTWNQEWLVQNHGEYTRAPWPNDTETAWLCFGHSETRAWAVEWISRLVEELDLAWIKWDSNWWGVCDGTHHDHDAGDGEFHQVAGAHAVMDELRRRFPDLIIENCAGGGTRMDFEMAKHTHVAWVNDSSELSHRVRFHLSGATYPFPPEVLNTWVAESKFEDLNQRYLPRPVLDSLFRSRMIGALGISCRIGEWPEETRAAMRDALVEYKALRPLLSKGEFRHLLPQTALLNPNLRTPAAWEAFQIYDPASGQGTILVFRGAAADGTRTISPTGLDAGASYTVSSAGTEPSTSTGAALMAEGISCELLPLTSTLVHLAAQVGASA